MEKNEIYHLVVDQALSHDHVARLLQRRYPGIRGLSSRAVRRFCKEHAISRRTAIDDDTLDAVVDSQVTMVGKSYGRRTMQGLLSSRLGICVNRTRVGQALGRVAPEAQRARTRSRHRLMNPIPYCASYFGEKLHCDQNEKLVRYGVTHVVAVDGFSRKVVGFITIPVKNAVAIYEHLYRPLILSTGLFHQVRTDHGREFDLMLAVQESLAPFRSNTSKAPYRRTTSSHNLRAERFWCEVNQRVNYPLKASLIQLEENGCFDILNEVHKFCVSSIAIQVSYLAVKNLIHAHNAHRIPGQNGGIPNVLAYRSQQAIGDVSPNVAPSVEEAVYEFTNAGGNLTLMSSFGTDPLQGCPVLQQERQSERRLADWKTTACLCQTFSVMSFWGTLTPWAMLSSFTFL